MKVARLVVLGVALVAGGTAAMLMGGQKNAPTIIQAPPPPPQIEVDDVLVSSHELPMGTVLKDGDIAWATWPKSSIGDGAIRKSVEPNVIEDMKGAVTRGSFLQGEPIRKEKVVKASNAGFLSALLSSGNRAVAINIDASGATSAGGFILPNDRVDIVRTSRDDQGNDTYMSETILKNIRVLAIGQNVQEKNGEKVAVGANATLEVTPAQAEKLILAQRVGQLSLVLRSMMDTANVSEEPVANDDNSLTIVRFGVANSVGKK
ncbi:Flp pilus assembly protein CpaB [Roseiarcaceae bacterium H3SJ34-1]|uniref:Flp pilus assembly protein CpaB n=1 Tax=Terripilifer ovatus TaxID=3032367 RepID=UPI003AB9919A|nr:Flp pilus assembly protein CpaB [Roseiarcaceae bacterium H3SJ34-1]